MPSAEHEAIVEALRAQRDAPAADIATMRANMEAMTATLPLVPGSECTDTVVAGVPVDSVAAPGADAERVIVYFHGGGYVMGSPATHRSLASRLSAAAGARVLLVDYRLAPEHPYPAAVDDAIAVWNGLLAEGTDPARAAVAGDSAGGGLVLALLERIRATGAPRPACAVCLSPWADLEGTGATGDVDDPMVTMDGLHEMAGHYGGDRRAEPEASPLHADYSGVPPLLIQVGTREVLLDDARRVARTAEAAGVAVTLEEEDGLIHVFQAFAGVPEAEAAVGRIGDFVRGHLA
jgi:acetyl esterase/lipase